MYRKKILYIGFGNFGGFRHPPGVLEYIPLRQLRTPVTKFIFYLHPSSSRRQVEMESGTKKNHTLHLKEYCSQFYPGYQHTSQELLFLNKWKKKMEAVLEVSDGRNTPWIHSWWSSLLIFAEIVYVDGVRSTIFS